jgi:hypothetical protein
LFVCLHTGMRSDRRYGQSFAGRSANAHQASHMTAKKYIDLPLDISHVCHKKLCVNPDHLSHEEHVVNVDREICRRKGQCTFPHRSADDTQLFKKCI